MKKLTGQGSFGLVLAANPYPGQIELEENSMRFRTALCLVSLFLVCLTVAAWSTPAADPPDSARLLRGPDNESISGKISAIGDAQFSMDVQKDKDLSTVQFFVDDQTTVEGK